MKYLVMALLTLVSISMFAEIRTVDNNNPSAGQYTTIQAAINAANNDDVIYVYPSNIPYAGFIVNRRLTIIGVGYPSLSNNTAIRRTIITGTATYHAGSEHSTLEGFDGLFNILFQGVAGNVTLKNCSLAYANYHYNNDYISAYYNNYNFINCLFSGGGANGSPNGYYYWIPNTNTQTGIMILNCILEGSAKIAKETSDNITIINSLIKTTSVLFPYLSSSHIFLRNSYIEAQYYCGTQAFPSTNTIAYNMSSTALFPTGTTNLNSIPLSSAFDAQYHPISGSPAINAGDPAADCNDLDGSRNDIGVFGGPYPYDDNGYTTLPTITDISGTLYTSPSQGLQIQVEASSRH